MAASISDRKPVQRISKILFLMLVINALASSLFGPLTNDIMRTCSMTLTEVGALVSASQAAVFLSFLALPALTRRLGSYRLLLVGILGSAIGFFLMGVSRTPWMFSIAFLTQSLLGYFYSSCNYAVMAQCDVKRRTTNIPLMHLVYSVGSIGAGAFVSWAGGPSWYKGYYVAAALYILGLLLFLTRWGEAKGNAALMPSIRRIVVSKHRHNPFSGFSLLLRKEFLVFFIFLICVTSIEYCATIYPVLFLELSWEATASMTGLSVTIYWVGSTVSRVFVMPSLKKGLNATVLLATLTGLCSVALAVIPLMPTASLALWTMPLLGFAFGALNPVSQIVEIRRWSDDMDQVANLHMISGVIGRLVLPVIVSSIGERSGLGPGLLLLAVLMALAVVMLLLSERLYRKSVLQDGGTMV
ncbi:MAG: MFS transporter [Sphaerochaetaceae bacterium]